MKWLKLSAVAALLLALHFILSGKDPLLQDLFFNIRGVRPPSAEILIAAVDESSINVVGNWPWNRVKIAELLDSLSSGSPAVIYLNLFFRQRETAGLSDDEAAKIREENLILANAVARSGRCIIPYYFDGIGEDDLSGVVLAPKKVLLNRIVRSSIAAPSGEVIGARILRYPEPVVAEEAEALGFYNVSPRFAIEAIRYGGDLYPSVSLQAAREYLNLEHEAVSIGADGAIQMGDRGLPTHLDGTSMINFYGPGKTFAHISAVEILGREYDKKQLTGKIVIVGVTDLSLKRDADPHPTPFDRMMPASEYWANIFQNTLDGSFIGYSSLYLTLWIPLLLILACAYPLTLLSLHSSFKTQLALIGGGLSTLFLLAFALFALGWWISITAPALYLAGLGGFCIVQQFRQGANSGAGLNTTGGAANTAEFSRTGKLQRIGRYQIIEEVGSGGMGTVFKATDPVINRTVAIKVVRSDAGLSGGASEARERFLREAHAAGAISHPNIVTIFDYGDTGTISYIAMEFLNGVSLEQRMQQETPLSLKEIVDIIRQAAEGLQHAHEQGVVHRDIKPANLMLVEGGARLKIMDFGIAKVNNAALTHTGTSLGTPNYMSPEQINGSPLDHRSDIYSLGIIAYELLCGRRPFVEENLSALSFAILTKHAENPSLLRKELPQAVDQVFERVLSKKPEERFGEACELARQLSQALT